MVHVLSSSVAKALRCLSYIAELKGCEATAIFIEKIDLLFDIFNSKSLYGKTTSLPEVLQHINEIKQYLLSLKTDDWKYINESSSLKMILKNFQNQLLISLKIEH